MCGHFCLISNELSGALHSQPLSQSPWHTHTHTQPFRRPCLPPSYQQFHVRIKSLLVFSWNLSCSNASHLLCYDQEYKGVSGGTSPVWLQELPSPASGAGFTTVLEPQRHLLFALFIQKGVVVWWFKFRFRRLTWEYGKMEFSYILKTWGSY